MESQIVVTIVPIASDSVVSLSHKATDAKCFESSGKCGSTKRTALPSQPCSRIFQSTVRDLRVAATNDEDVSSDILAASEVLLGVL